MIIYIVERKKGFMISCWNDNTQNNEQKENTEYCDCGKIIYIFQFTRPSEHEFVGVLVENEGKVLLACLDREKETNIFRYVDSRKTHHKWHLVVSYYKCSSSLKIFSSSSVRNAGLNSNSHRQEIGFTFCKWWFISWRRPAMKFGSLYYIHNWRRRKTIQTRVEFITQNYQTSFMGSFTSFFLALFYVSFQLTLAQFTQSLNKILTICRSTIEFSRMIAVFSSCPILFWVPVWPDGQNKCMQTCLTLFQFAWDEIGLWKMDRNSAAT